MKLAVIEADAGLVEKVKLSVMSLLMGGRAAVPDILPLLAFRPRLFGASFNGYCQRVLRGESAWTVAEREVMATFASRANRCEFCETIHREVAAQALEAQEPGTRARSDERLADPTSAAHSDKLKAALTFLDKLVRSPGEMSVSDVEAVRAAGISDAALEDVIHIASIFATINRIADSLGFTVPDGRATAQAANVLLKRGYRL